jgi:hypothetical protein
MSFKFFYLYLVGGTVALLLAVYPIVIANPVVSLHRAFLYLLPSLLLYYMAYKVYHVKKDHELM